MVIENSKTCLECQQTLALDQFYRKGDRFYSRCKPCVSKDRKGKYQRKISLNVEDKYNIIIKQYDSKSSVNNRDLLSILESFLIEEFVSEQRTT